MASTLLHLGDSFRSRLRHGLSLRSQFSPVRYRYKIRPTRWDSVALPEISPTFCNSSTDGLHCYLWSVASPSPVSLTLTIYSTDRDDPGGLQVELSGGFNNIVIHRQGRKRTIECRTPQRDSEGLDGAMARLTLGSKYVTFTQHLFTG